MNLRALIYGQPGAGKTTLLGTGADDPRTTPGLLLDFEAGTIAILSKAEFITLDDLGPEPSEGKIHVLTVTAWDDFMRILDFLWQEDSPYAFVGIDSLTEVNYLCLSTVVQGEIQRNPSHDPDVSELRDYLKSANRMRTLIRDFRDLDAHVVFTCGLTEDPDSKTKLQKKGPAMTGKLKYETCGLVDIVGYLDVVQDGRVLVTAPADDAIAKDRSEGGLLGGTLEKPTLTNILDLLQGLDENLDVPEGGV